MPCFKPRTVGFSKSLDLSPRLLTKPGRNGKPHYFWRQPTGKRSVVFKESESLEGSGFKLPCGQCIGCRLDRARDWTTRCVLEASCHEANSFLTLTYAPEHLPEDGSLNMAHFSSFVKRFRSEFPDIGISIFACGEYGDQFSRPHFHACFFGFDFSHDRQFFRRSDLGYPIYISESLSRLWGKGFCEIGSLTPQSAGYVARYVVKKVTGKEASEHYQGRVPEGPAYISKKPAIGLRWFEKFSDDVYSNDFIMLDNKKVKVPRYFDKLYERLVLPETYASLKEKRKLEGELRACWDDEIELKVLEDIHRDSDYFGTPLVYPLTRLQVKEQCQLLKLKKLSRRYDEIGSDSDL